MTSSVDGQSMHMFVTDRETDETYHITWDKVWMAENLSTIAMHKTSLRGSGLIKRSLPSCLYLYWLTGLTCHLNLLVLSSHR
jgi:hypothetical protein